MCKRSSFSTLDFFSTLKTLLIQIYAKENNNTKTMLKFNRKKKIIICVNII